MSSATDATEFSKQCGWPIANTPEVDAGITTTFVPVPANDSSVPISEFLCDWVLLVKHIHLSASVSGS